MKKEMKLIRYFFDPFDEKYKSIINGILFGVFTIFLFFLIITTIERIKVFDTKVIIEVTTLFAVLMGVYVAIWKLFHDHRWSQSETYLKQTLSLLEKSFNSLKLDKTTGYPTNNRDTWLSSSRLLLAAQELGRKITDISHIDTYTEHAEYWRQQFRDILEPNGVGIKDKYYFYENGSLHGWSVGKRAPIAEESIVAIYRFMAWPNSREDLLKKGDIFTDKELHNIKFFAEGLYDYCNEKRTKS